MNSHLKRVLISVCVSLIIFFAMASNARIVSSLDDLTTYDHVIDILGTPAFVIVDWLMGEGALLDRIWIYLAASWIFYAVAVWIVLSLCSRIRAVKKHGDKQFPTAPSVP